MAKANGKQPSKNNQNKHIISRISYLQKAATYLSQNTAISIRKREEDAVLGRSPNVITSQTGQRVDVEDDITRPGVSLPNLTLSAVPACGSQCHLLNHLRQTARKAQVRVALDIKRSVCKCCDALLLEGSTCIVKMENHSKHGKKPCSAVRVVECSNCGAKKRFPIGAKRQLRKGKRGQENEKDLNGEKVPEDASIN